MSILEKIAQAVKLRVAERKGRVSLASLESKVKKRSSVFVKKLSESGPHIIAEIKFQSPSQGVFTKILQPGERARRAEEIAGAYLSGGASAISILTEEDYFSGSPLNLQTVRGAHPHALLLMKDFMIDEYQFYEAAHWGADAVLIIMALLGRERAETLMKLAHSLGLSTLVEVHNEEEMIAAKDLGAELIGVNNRDLKTLQVSLDVSRKLARYIDGDEIHICESGIDRLEQIKEMTSLGFKGFLIGSSLMKTGHPGQALKNLLAGLKA